MPNNLSAMQVPQEKSRNDRRLTEAPDTMIKRWTSFAKDDDGRRETVKRVEADLREWVGSEEYKLKALRQRAIANNEVSSTIMIIDARIRELGEIRKVVFGN